jgi:hypothetical protein
MPINNLSSFLTLEFDMDASLGNLSRVIMDKGFGNNELGLIVSSRSLIIFFNLAFSILLFNYQVNQHVTHGLMKSNNP